MEPENGGQIGKPAEAHEQVGRVPQHEPVRHWMANRSESPLVGMEAREEGETQAFRGQEVLLKPASGRCAVPQKATKKGGCPHREQDRPGVPKRKALPDGEARQGLANGTVQVPRQRPLGSLGWRV